MIARVTTVQVSPDKTAEATNIYQNSVLPAAKAQQGFRTGYMLTDAASGKGMSVTIWDSLADLQASEANGFYQEQVAKFAPLFTAPPTREIYEVGASA
ncbi:MAG TPA: antibiotic biosynthesis monooxygenase [Ktedonobacterales bacterium]|nr:antibiotic biosynthesis monooxygenase [Ktedonobacterales bacterium]